MAVNAPLCSGEDGGPGEIAILWSREDWIISSHCAQCWSAVVEVDEPTEVAELDRWRGESRIEEWADERIEPSLLPPGLRSAG